MKDNNIPRRVAIIIAVILGILVAFYLGGILGQMNTGYQDWLASDGMSGNATMKPLRFDPLYCLGNAFTKEGLVGTLLVIGLTAAIIIYAKLHDKFSSHDQDDRNFTRSKKGTYGTAGWMTGKEMKKVLEITTPENAKGIILGQKNGSVICLPADTMLNKHLCVFGASGTMKSRAIVRPYLFQSIKRGDSVVVTDVKGELYSDTAEMFRRNGYTVRVFNLVNPAHSDSWNCMSDLDGDTMMAQILTNITIQNTSKGKVDHFWDNGEGNLLKSLILYVDQDATRSPDAKHLPAVYQMLTQNTEKSLSAMFDKLPITHPAKAPYSLFAQASETVRSGIVLGLGTRLQVLQNEAIKKITSKSELDLSEPGRTKCAYFVILSDQESSTEFISSLFFSLLFIKLTRYADSMPDQRCKVPVNIVFDEFSNIGQLDTYPRRLSVVRSRQIQICHIVQSLAQFQNRYPEEQWAEIIGNCDTQVMLGCTEEETANYWSMRSGDMSVEVNSTMTVRQTIAVAQMIPQYRHTEGLGKRRLLTPDEVFRIPNKEMLIIIRGENMLRADKFDYTGHPYAKRMIKSSVFDYNPETKQQLPQTESDPELNITERDTAARPQTENSNPRRQVGKPEKTSFGETETENHLGSRKTRKSPLKFLELFMPPAKKPHRRRPSQPRPGANSPTSGDAGAVRQEKPLIYQNEPETAPGTAGLPEVNPAGLTKNALCQTDLELSNSGSCPHVPGEKTALCQTENEKQFDELNIPASGLDTAPSQTDPENAKPRGSRRAKQQTPPEPDYEKLLDSFRQSPAKPPQQPKTKTPRAVPNEDRILPDAELPGTPPDEAPPSQSGGRMPLISTAIEIGPVNELTGSFYISGEQPPDDF